MIEQAASQTLQGICGLELCGCPCGYFSHPTKECICSPSLVARYQKRISGPLLDRVDIFVDVPPVEYEKLVGTDLEETSSQVRERVEKARRVQRQRFHDTPFTHTTLRWGPRRYGATVKWKTTPRGFCRRL